MFLIVCMILNCIFFHYLRDCEDNELFFCMIFDCINYIFLHNLELFASYIFCIIVELAIYMILACPYLCMIVGC